MSRVWAQQHATGTFRLWNYVKHVPRVATAASSVNVVVKQNLTTKRTSTTRASAIVTGTNTRKIVKSVDYALALTGTWLDDPRP